MNGRRTKNAFRLLPLLLCALFVFSSCESGKDPALPDNTENGTVLNTGAGRDGEDAGDSGQSGIADAEEKLDIKPDPSLLPVSGKKWAIYWYMCGSNLESLYGCAAEDLAEAAKANIPEDVVIILETGGARTWHDPRIKSGVIQRHVLDSEGLHLVEELPDASMGDEATLADFLGFCRDNCDAEKKMMLFWNHGGGSVAGAMFDETHFLDALKIDEIGNAFESTFGTSVTPDAEPPFEIIGFDACLMSTVDVASRLRTMGKYLVASEELEPGNGWYYTGWLGALSENSDIGGEELGKAICDSYYADCESRGTHEEITLAVTDLSKIPGLVEVYDALGKEALVAALDTPGFMAAFGREATRTESYGGNTPEQGYTNMTDLGHLARNLATMLPNNSKKLLDTLDDCVVYKVNGPYRTEATGLSCFYSYNADIRNFNAFTGVGASDAFKYFYAYGITGNLSESGKQFVTNLGMNADDLARIPGVEDFDIEAETSVTFDDYGFPVLHISDELLSSVRDVRLRVRQLTVDEDEKLNVLAWGESDLMTSDWENGSFTSRFGGYVASLDNRAVYTEIVCHTDTYTLYSIPILLNGSPSNLQAVNEKIVTILPGGGKQTEYDWHIIGAREGIDESGMADKNLHVLKNGDVINPIYAVNSDPTSNDNWRFMYVPENEFRYSEAYTDFNIYTTLPDACYDIDFEMVDVHGKKAYSDRVVLRVNEDDNTIWLQLYDDFIAGKDTAIERYRYE